MKAYKGTFVKKNGQTREMIFARIEDISAVNEEFISSKIYGSASDKTYKGGMELVFDIECEDFRVFNYKTAIGDIEEFDFPDYLFNI